MQDNNIDSALKNEDALVSEERYKKVTTNSLLSYENTNEAFKKLTMEHKKIVEECQSKVVDIETTAKKSNDIHRLMSEEILKANKIISELSQQVKILAKSSNIDELTKVLNRRALLSYLDKICTNKIKYELHFLIFNINDFQEINDIHGHLAGDRILIYIANILKKVFREGDKLFRYGGEDFVIILNRIDEAKCKIIVNRLLETIKTAKLIYKGKTIKLTVSIGITKYNEKDTHDSLIARADKALHKAKSSGKNKTYSEI